MSFQQRPQRRTPRCPWCDQEMVPSPDSRGGRLFCPTGEAVEYRLSGGRWYFNGRLNGLDEPIPPAPEDGTMAVDERMPDDIAAPLGRTAGPVAQAAPAAPEADSLDPLDAFRRIASDAWGAQDADDESGRR